MDHDRVKQYLFAVLLGAGIVASWIAFYQIGRSGGYRAGLVDGACAVARADTIWRVDTHFIDRPVEVWREREKVVYLAVHDTQIVHTTDSVFVALERETREYSGDEYQARVSGVDPRLEWVKVFPRTMEITNTKVVRKRWGFGVTAGPGVFWDGQGIKPGAGVAAGFTYNF